jgi:hypothetical protein
MIILIATLLSVGYNRMLSVGCANLTLLLTGDHRLTNSAFLG